MPVGDQDLGVFFRDWTAVTLADGSTMQAHFDIPEDVEHFGVMRLGTTHDGAAEIAGKPTIRYATASTPAGFVHGTVVTIGGVKYKVRNTQKEGDGQVSVAGLQKV